MSSAKIFRLQNSLHVAIESQNIQVVLELLRNEKTDTCCLKKIVNQ